MRLFQRAIRRAQLPVRWSGGFNPRPKMAFPLALSVGVKGRRELMELECQGDVSPHSVQQALAAQLPAGVRLRRAEEVPTNRRSRVVGIVYRFQLQPGQAVEPQAVTRLLAQPRIEVARGRDGAKRVDIRPFIKNIHVRKPSGGRGQVLTVLLSVEPSGTAKAREILAILGIDSLPGELSPDVERTRMCLASSP